MDYNILVSEDAEDDLNRFLQYLLLEKKSKQAAKNVLDDFEETIRSLSVVAGSLKLCDNPRLKQLGYKRINFKKHKYFMLFRMEGNTAIVDSIFHFLQDYENKMI